MPSAPAQGVCSVMERLTGARTQRCIPGPFLTALTIGWPLKRRHMPLTAWALATVTWPLCLSAHEVLALTHRPVCLPKFTAGSHFL